LQRANALREAHRFAEADELCRNWLDQAPDDAEAIFLRGMIAKDDGRPGDALPLVDDAIARVAAPAAWLSSRALVLQDLGRMDEALVAVEAAIERDSVLVEAHAARATLLMSMRRPAEAVVSLEQLIRLQPDNVGAVLYATSQLLLTYRPHAALALIDVELAVRPNDPRSHVGRAQVLRALNRLDEALDECDRSIQIQDDYARAWFIKCLILLALGRYAEGWPLYEWRWLTPEFLHRQPTFLQPLWDGSSLSGRTLLVHAEQGLGDSIQLFRFVTALHRPIVLCVQPGLARLFAMQPDAPLIIAYGDIIPPTDLYCMMGSLPWLLGAELQNLPAAPYLSADPVGAAEWGARLPRRPRIGIIWAGNAGHADDQNRSLPLRTMLEMLDPGMTIVSLQKDVPETDRATIAQAPHVIDLSAELTDFSVTAAVMDGLDLIISVDTAPAHLAGALGRPLWLLLPFAPDWRWMLDREDSPWYPSARLFRQDQPGDWSGVAGRVREALKGLSAIP
jgi:tetratricopeptide (TPR) repeat protein